MKRTLIALGLLLLLAIGIKASNPSPSEAEAVLKLAYNPTYDLWYFRPRGRPEDLTDAAMDAYWQQRPGGVCYTQTIGYFYCATGELIN